MFDRQHLNDSLHSGLFCQRFVVSTNHNAPQRRDVTTEEKIWITSFFKNAVFATEEEIPTGFL